MVTPCMRVWCVCCPVVYCAVCKRWQPCRLRSSQTELQSLLTLLIDDLFFPSSGIRRAYVCTRYSIVAERRRWYVNRIIVFSFFASPKCPIAVLFRRPTHAVVQGHKRLSSFPLYSLTFSVSWPRPGTRPSLSPTPVDPGWPHLVHGNLAVPPGRRLASSQTASG